MYNTCIIYAYPTAPYVHIHMDVWYMYNKCIRYSYLIHLLYIYHTSIWICTYGAVGYAYIIHVLYMYYTYIIHPAGIPVLYIYAYPTYIIHVSYIYHTSSGQWLCHWTWRCCRCSLRVLCEISWELTVWRCIDVGV